MSDPIDEEPVACKKSLADFLNMTLEEYEEWRKETLEWMNEIWKPDSWQVDPEDICEHKQCVPEFDEIAAKNMSAFEVRARWPRFEGTCPDCGQNVIIYATFSHYILGDYNGC